MALDFPQTGIPPHRSSEEVLGGVFGKSSASSKSEPTASGDLATILYLAYSDLQIVRKARFGNSK